MAAPRGVVDGLIHEALRVGRFNTELATLDDALREIINRRAQLEMLTAAGTSLSLWMTNTTGMGAVMANKSDREYPLLRDKDQFPTDAVIADALGAAFPAYQTFISKIAAPEYKLDCAWRFYNDGKAWLGKVARGKTTALWLSIWPGYFQAGFYFTEKTSAGIPSLNIADELKQDFQERKSVGKSKPLVIKVFNADGLPDLFTVITYKLSAK